MKTNSPCNILRRDGIRIRLLDKLEDFLRRQRHHIELRVLVRNCKRMEGKDEYLVASCSNKSTHIFLYGLVCSVSYHIITQHKSSNSSSRASAAAQKHMCIYIYCINFPMHAHFKTRQRANTRARPAVWKINWICVIAFPVQNGKRAQELTSPAAARQIIIVLMRQEEGDWTLNLCCVHDRSMQLPATAHRITECDYFVHSTIEPCGEM